MNLDDIQKHNERVMHQWELNHMEPPEPDPPKGKCEGESQEALNNCPRCGEGSWNWKLLDEDFSPNDSGYREYMCQCCGLFIYENYAWSHTDWCADD